MQRESKDISNRNLWQDTAFRCIAAIGVAVVVISFTFTMFAEKQWGNFCFTAECLAATESMLSFHFKVVSVWLVFLGIYAAIFRSVQTATQIDISSKQVAATESQNKFTNYYAHRKMFFEHLGYIEESRHVKFYDKSKLYRDFFPNTNPQSGVQDESYVDPYVGNFIRLIDLLDTNCNRSEMQASWDRLTAGLKHIKIEMAFDFSRSDNEFIDSDDLMNMSRPEPDEEECYEDKVVLLINSIYTLLGVIQEIGQFHRGFNFDFREQESSLREFAYKIADHLS